MYIELIELCVKNNIDIEKAYVAFICKSTIGTDDPTFEEVCEMTYKQMYEDDEEKDEIV